MSNPKVAIITRTKDRPLFLQRAMYSVLGQTLEDWVHVIVNDGGDPKMVDMLVEVQKHAYAGRVKVVHHAESQGMQNAANAGLAAVDSTFVVIHDDDDSWYPDFLEQTVSFLEEEGPESLVQGVVTQTTQVMEEVTLSGHIEEFKRRPYYPFAFINLGELRQRNIFPPIAFLYRRQVHEKIGLFRQEFDVLGDHDFNLRFVRHFEIGVIPTFHAYYHWRHGSHGNTVTRHREVHRQMLNRMKNAYYRETLEHPESAVGDLKDVEFPPPESLEQIPFQLRTEEPPSPLPMPAFRDAYTFEVLSLDVFDTVLKRRCHHPKDVFKILEERAVNELGLPKMPYALAREKAEQKVRHSLQREVTLSEIYKALAKLCQLKPPQVSSLKKLELAIEREMLYADSRWLDLYDAYRADGIRIIFVSDMYLSRAIIINLLKRCGFKDPEVYVSCEYKATKHDGTLQDIVVSELGVEPGRILHVGDNFNSDCVRTWQAGWQAFHWSPEFNYKPWYAQADPFHHCDGDLLSLRIMGEVQCLGQLYSSSNDDLMVRLGREVAGPLYLSYLVWVLREAKADGLRKLILLGRDGYYWEKSLQLFSEKVKLGVDFCYLHSSRKVLNFASFTSLDETAIELLLTPNPALRVRDFLDRTGLKFDQHLALIQQVGFSDPDKILTNEMGGNFLESCYPRQLRDLFQLLKPELEKMFVLDRRGMLMALDDAGYDPKDCALVDIGWNGSCVKTVARLLEVEAPDSITGYFFGTWKEADAAGFPGIFKSFFMHLGKPVEHAALLRESINWIESLHAAPYPTLLAFGDENSDCAPQFSELLRSGFSVEEQDRLWTGARQFLESAISGGLPEGGKYPGFTYINLVLNRVLREPSPAELEAWGKILHSEGFGLEVYKRLIEPVDEKTTGQELLQAYRGSNWKRGFLASLPENQRYFVLERIEERAPKSYEQLKADLDFKIRQTDELWGEKEQHKWQANQLGETVSRLEKSMDKLQGDLVWKSNQTDKIWEEKEAHRAEAKTVKEHLAAAKREHEQLSTQITGLSNEIASLNQQLDQQVQEKEAHRAEAQTFKEQLSAAKREHEQLSGQITGLRNEIASLNQQLDQQVQEKEAHRAEAQTFKEQLAAVQTEQEQLGAQITGLSNEIASLNQQLDQLHQENKAGQQREAELNGRCSLLEEELGALNKQREELTSERDHLKSLLQRRGKMVKIFFTREIPPKE